MNTNEILTLALSLISVIIAITSLIRTRKIAAEQLKLEKITAKLAEKQMSQIDEAAHEKTQPKLNVTLTKIGKSHRFLIVNRGEGSAFNLTFELIDCPNSPLSQSEVDEKFPFQELKSQSSVRLLAGIYMGCPRVYRVRLTWNDSSAINYSEEFHVSL